jgi:GNAT superfamily N-acetyltransferase
MLIRRIEPGDLGPLLALYHELHPEDQLPSDDAVRIVWPQLLTDPRVTVFVGELAGGLVATCTLTIVPNLTRGARPYALVENVVTARDHRLQGHGTSILRHATAHAWDQGCYKVMLLSSSQQEATLRFYERAGFQRGVETGFVAVAPGPA